MMNDPSHLQYGLTVQVNQDPSKIREPNDHERDGVTPIDVVRLPVMALICDCTNCEA